MKTIICLLILLIGNVSLANEPKPKYMKDAVITVTLENGKQFTFSENDYKVVPRIQKEVVSNWIPAPSPEKPAEVAQKSKHDNEVSLYVGYGATGLSSSTVNNATTVEQKNGVVFGLGYSRKIKDPVNAKAVIFNNNSYFGGLGLEF